MPGVTMNSDMLDVSTDDEQSGYEQSDYSQHPLVSEAERQANDEIQKIAEEFIEALADGGIDALRGLLPIDVTQKYTVGCQCGCSERVSVFTYVQGCATSVDMMRFLVDEVLTSDQALGCLSNYMRHSSTNDNDNYKPCAEFLLSHIPPNDIIDFMYVEDSGDDRYENTLLHMALFGYTNDCVAYCHVLLDLGCDPFKVCQSLDNGQLVSTGRTPFSLMVAGSHADLVRRVTENYPNIDINYYDKTLLNPYGYEGFDNNMLIGLFSGMSHNINRETHEFWTEEQRTGLYLDMRAIIQILIKHGITLTHVNSSGHDYKHYLDLYPRSAGFHELFEPTPVDEKISHR
jgi:hypothetical protein